MSWTHSNLSTQGYHLSVGDARVLRVGLRFPTALCLALVVTGLALEWLDARRGREAIA